MLVAGSVFVRDVALADADTEPFAEEGGCGAELLRCDMPAALGAGGLARPGDRVAVSPVVEDRLEVLVALVELVEEQLAAVDREQRSRFLAAGDRLDLGLA